MQYNHPILLSNMTAKTGTTDDIDMPLFSH